MLVLLMVLLFVKRPTIVEATPLTDSVTIEYHVTPVGWWNEGVRLTITNLDYSGTVVSVQYVVGDWARNVYSETLPEQYVYAKVELTPAITQNGGIRLAQFDESDDSLTYATVTSISATQIRLKCDTSYNLRVWGFN